MGPKHLEPNFFLIYSQIYEIRV